MDLATALIWALRILLPIILFCIYFKLQKGSDEHYRGDALDREKLLSHRKVVRDFFPPPVSKIRLTDASESPHLFTGGGDRRGSKNSRRGSEASRDRRDRRKHDLQPQEEADENINEEFETKEATKIEIHSPAEQKMHMESLLNYVAFNRKEQQRVFLPDTDGAPPPPPPSKKKEAAVVSGQEADKANADAQLVLQGAKAILRADVAKNLHQQLQEAQVEIRAQTFVVLIETCIFANDLKAASDFLMTMENAGFSPNSEILDKVMDLYARTKAQKVVTQPVVNHPPGHFEDIFLRADAEGPRTKLSSAAAAFVPTFGPTPLAQAHVANGAECGEPSEDLLRTKLTAAAKPFEPKFNDPEDSGMFLWTGDAQEDMYCEENDDYYPAWSEWSRGKSKERGKSRGKNNGDAKWKEKDWEIKKIGETKKNGEHKSAKSTTDGKKSGGLVWKPKVTTTNS